MIKKTMTIKADSEVDILRTMEAISVPFRDILKSLNEQGLWYQSNGYSLSSFVSAARVSQENAVALRHSNVAFEPYGDESITVPYIKENDNEFIYTTGSGLNSFRFWWDESPTEIKLPCEEPSEGEQSIKNWGWDNSRYTCYSLNCEWTSFTGGLKSSSEGYGE